MTDDEQQIRNLIETWAEAVHEGEKLGPLLVVLDRPRDDGFLTLLQGSIDPELEYAFDFRHESWAEADVPVRVNSLEGEAPPEPVKPPAA